MKKFRAELPKLLLLLLSFAALLIVLPACGGGDDDDLGGPGDGGEDNAAPFVAGIFPEDGSLITDLNTSFFIDFNEDMNHDSAAGNITISPETTVDISWTNSLSLILSPSTLPEATEITVNFGAGLTDISGNSLVP